MKTIDKHIVAILRQCTFTNDGTALHLPDIQLERSVYVAVNKVLEQLGGKWNRAQKAHLFETDVSDIFMEVCLSSQYEAKLDELNKVYNFFETPVELALRMVQFCHLGPTESVLEPSAGRGAIAHQLRNCGFEPDVIEPHPDMRERLSTYRFNIVGDDFLEHMVHYDVIVANPPFSGGRDARHILHMIELANRMVVSVCSTAVMFRETGPYPELRKKVAELGGDFIRLDEGSFKESGTMVNTCLVVVEKKCPQ